MLGWTLWDKTRDFETMARDYFAAAFGPEGKAALAYLTQLSGLFDPEYLRGEKSLDGRSSRNCVGARSGCGRCVLADDRAQHSQRHCLLGPLVAVSCGITPRSPRHWPAPCANERRAILAAAQLEWDALKQRMWQKEDELHPVLDVYLFTRVYDGIFKTGRPR